MTGDKAREAQWPLDVPLVAVYRDGALYAALDAREVRIERRGPEIPQTAMWRLLLRDGEAWRDAGYAGSQTETERYFLQDRVRSTLAAFDGRSVEEFSFRIWEGPAPESAGRVSGEEVDRSDPTVARLRRICRAVVLETPNQEEKLLVSLAFERGGDYVLHMRDDFDWSDYYVPVPPGVDPEAMAAEYGQRSMQRVLGILRSDGTSLPPPPPGADSPPPPPQPLVAHDPDSLAPGLLTRVLRSLGSLLRRF